MEMLVNLTKKTVIDNTGTFTMTEKEFPSFNELQEAGFTWAQSSEALKTHDTIEEAIEALFAGNASQSAGGVYDIIIHGASKIPCHFSHADDLSTDASTGRNITKQPSLQVQEGDSEWVVRRKSQTRSQQVKESEAVGHIRSNSQSPTRMSKTAVKP